MTITRNVPAVFTGVESAERFPFVVASNRLPVDLVRLDSGEEIWRTAPGGLVSAMQPVVEQLGCAWVGWAGDTGSTLQPFTHDALRLVPLELDEGDLELYYEGFCNDTLWPLFHDVTAPPRYHRHWYERYARVNERFARTIADTAAPNATVWVHDYQLMLVPELVRTLRPDVTVAYFLHIPFPAYGLFSQIPWRRQLLTGLLGADVVGFQRPADAQNFRTSVQRLLGLKSHGAEIHLPGEAGEERRTVTAAEFPISIDTAAFTELANSPEVIERSHQIRAQMGYPETLILGVDRLDYTKGIAHRIKAFGELLESGTITPGEAVLLQVASPSRENVHAYQELRDAVELSVARTNGEYGSIEYTPIQYLYQVFDRTEMAALYRAADVLLVTALRDGMNLVAKEYVASRPDHRGVLVLSEFAGAADQLKQAIRINPHDIEATKAAVLLAKEMPLPEQSRRMKTMQQHLMKHDVHHWAKTFLNAVTMASSQRVSVSQ